MRSLHAPARHGPRGSFSPRGPGDPPPGSAPRSWSRAAPAGHPARVRACGLPPKARAGRRSTPMPRARSVARAPTPRSIQAAGTAQFVLPPAIGAAYQVSGNASWTGMLRPTQTGEHYRQTLGEDPWAHPRGRGYTPGPTGRTTGMRCGWPPVWPSQAHCCWQLVGPNCWCTACSAHSPGSTAVANRVGYAPGTRSRPVCCSVQALLSESRSLGCTRARGCWWWSRWRSRRRAR
ncbi:Uncharacterised protein [Mycobacteroides abscessus subsp. abscessus]|nr:Uncharacterised protein [Mycobacteroides abscessus subsp. abscessus]